MEARTRRGGVPLSAAEAEAMESEDNTMVNRDGDTEWIVPRWVGELC